MNWHQLNKMQPRDFVCGHCGKHVASKEGYSSTDPPPQPRGNIYVCPGCARPTFFYRGTQIPGVTPGNEVEHLPPDVASLYLEARRAASIGATTASVLACRKLLMSIAVAQGAKPGESFVFYVEYLASAGYVPPNGRGWVDHIRSKGNEATHEIKLMVPGDAAELIAFAEMLLKFVFEFPARVPKSAS